MEPNWMVARLGWTSPSLRELILQPLGCTWGDLPAPGMRGEVERGEEGGGIGMDIEAERIGDMEEGVGEMTIAGGDHHPHTGEGEEGAGPGHSHQEERDTDQLEEDSHEIYHNCFLCCTLTLSVFHFTFAFQIQL